MTVTEIKGFGQADGRRGVYRGSAHVVDFMPKVMIEIVAVELMVASIIDAIARAARTGRVGDGTIFVSEVVEVVRIRTGLGGDDAI